MDVPHILNVDTVTRQADPWHLADAVARGALIFGLLGFGLGSFVIPVFSLPFDAVQQWCATGVGVVTGMFIGAAWGHRHRS